LLRDVQHDTVITVFLLLSIALMPLQPLLEFFHMQQQFVKKFSSAA
jgi:hypothetical protein